MTDNVTLFPGSSNLPENPMKMAPRHPGWCRHDAVVIDEHTRTIQCADPKCGAALDPFDFIRNQANTIGRAWEAYKHVQRENHDAAERLTVLKKEEQRLRSMVKRLQEKSGGLVTLRPGKSAL